ncbi:hypothetical protein AB0N05_16455 [Nocardia sp. NPDC051030]|uniref:hypothetical protein n=1 Tax=Nocardia sp. NPDC051030 TaxID=3155162 RepID=UPI003435B63B
MTRTTPPRPVDLEAAFPELTPLARTATRLHPRPGDPSPQDSSIGGPLLWPASEPWPHCPGHDHAAGPLLPLISLADAKIQRRIDKARGSRPERAYTTQERALLERIERLHNPEGPIAMLPLAQLYVRDVPGLRAPDGMDLLQVLWCPFEHVDDAMPATAVVWRSSAAVTEILLAPPEPAAVAYGVDFVPEPCVLDPEVVIEYPGSLELDRELRERVEPWARAEHHIEYANLCIPPGWKVGGYVNWGLTDPYPSPCPACGSATELLLSIASREKHFGGDHWIPYQDQAAHAAWSDGQSGPNAPTGICVGDGFNLIIRICAASPEHPHTQIVQ